ncbi:unnamed protein product [Clonostachys byssicola]|uniref:Inositol oxygenase n=1 Tax=Clonostachys byssicola TaxID=160290 RepID=A0A9N9XZI8_9HYPO|nr:unnamed protein product [Clonostachys byssicola]
MNTKVKPWPSLNRGLCHASEFDEAKDKSNFHQFLDAEDVNKDVNHPLYSTKFGIYSCGCDLYNVMLSWGHDEYVYHIIEDQSTIPAEGLFNPLPVLLTYHREGAYQKLINEKDTEMLKAVVAFYPYGLCSKSDEVPTPREGHSTSPSG